MPVVSARIPDDLLDRLGHLAQKRGLNRSQIVAAAIADYLTRQDRQDGDTVENESLEAMIARVIRAELARVQIQSASSAEPIPVAKMGPFLAAGRR